MTEGEMLSSVQNKSSQLQIITKFHIRVESHVKPESVAVQSTRLARESLSAFSRDVAVALKKSSR